MRRLFLLLMFMISTAALLQAQVSANDIVGIWFSHAGEAGSVSLVEVFEHEGKYYAYGMAYKEKSTGNEMLDVKNPDPALRRRKMNEVVFLYDVVFNSAKEQWEGGEIYRPGDGKYFYVAWGRLSPDRKTLVWRVSVDRRGLMGANLEWTRVPDEAKYAAFKTPKDILIKNIPKERKKK